MIIGISFGYLPLIDEQFRITQSLSMLSFQSGCNEWKKIN